MKEATKDEIDTTSATPVKKPKVTSKRQEQKRRARKLLSKSRKGVGITSFQELEELHSIHEYLCHESDDAEKNPSTYDNESVFEIETPVPFIILSSQTSHKSKNKKRKANNSADSKNSGNPEDNMTETSDKSHMQLVRSKWQQSTGSDIRHIIQRLLLYEGGPPMPSWCTLRNPVCCQNVAVVEFTSQSSKFSLASMLAFLQNQSSSSSSSAGITSINQDTSPKESILIDLLRKGIGTTEKKIGIPLKTTLFEGNSPKTLTDTLMYATTKPLVTQKPKKAADTTSKTAYTKSIKEKLFDMILTEDERRVNGYRFPAPCNFDGDNNYNDSDDDDNTLNNESSSTKRKEAARRKIMMQYANCMIQTSSKPECSTNQSTDKLYSLSPLGESQAIIQDIKILTNSNKDLELDENDQNKEGQNENVSESKFYVETFLPQNIDCCVSTDNMRKIYGLDCEMVNTENGSELARVTLVRLDIPEHSSSINREVKYTTVLDELVKPYAPVWDYLEQYSGINAKMLNPVQTRLEQIQLALLQIIKQTDLLIGHSLENDFKVLRLIHSCVIDTAVLFSTSGRKHSLRHLAAVLMKKDIQQNKVNKNDKNDMGHCSEEDAITSMELAIRRAIDGDSFRLIQEENKRRKSNIMLRMEEMLKQKQMKKSQTQGQEEEQDDQPQGKKKRKNGNNGKKTDEECPLYKYPGSFVYIGPSDWISTNVNTYKSSAHALVCESIKNERGWRAIPAFLKSKQRPASLLWANLSMPKDESNTTGTDVINNKKRKTEEMIMKENIQDIEKVIQHVVLGCPSTCKIILLFQGGLEKALEMEKLKKVMSQPKATLPWTDTEEESLKATVDRCRLIETILI